MSKSLEATPPGEASTHPPGLRRPAVDGAPEHAPGTTPSPSAQAAGLLRAARPRQWLKNVLVLAAPAAAGVLTRPSVALGVGLAFVAFCLVASGTYLLNDARDLEADRRHPTKRHRPIAAGVVSPRLAVASGVLVLALGLGLAAAVSLKLLAVDVPLSRWFLIVASFGSLFMVAGKRAGEYAELGDDRTATRATLGVYSLTYLREIRVIAAAVTLLAYCLWAFEQSGPRGSAHPFFELSI